MVNYHMAVKCTSFAILVALCLYTMIWTTNNSPVSWIIITDSWNVNYPCRVEDFNGVTASIVGWELCAEYLKGSFANNLHMSHIYYIGTPRIPFWSITMKLSPYQCVHCSLHLLCLWLHRGHCIINICIHIQCEACTLDCLFPFLLRPDPCFPATPSLNAIVLGQLPHCLTLPG